MNQSAWQILRSLGFNNNVTREGCLSLPDQYGEVSRPDRVKIRYINENNETVDREVSGL